MATPSASIVESLIGAIPIEVGAALVARVGERATITAKSGSIEVGSVALTVEAMDDLIAQVLPPDQLESLQENGTVHFEFKPQVIGGDFAVLAASTPGDRWLEIRRRTTAVAAATTTPAVVSAPAVTLAAAPAAEAMTPVPAAAPPAVPAAVTDGTDVAQLLSRFNTSTQTAPAASWERPPVAADAPLFRPAESFIAEQSPVEADFDLNLAGKVPIKETSPQPAPVAQRTTTNDDLSVPSILDFPAAKSDFDLDDLSLPDTLPGSGVASFATEAGSESSDSDHITLAEPKARAMGKVRFSTSTTESEPRRSVTLIASVVLGLVVLGAGGWYAAQSYLSTPSVVAPPPAAAARKTMQPNAAASNTPANAPKAAAVKPNASVATQKPEAEAPVPPVARAKADPPAPKPTIARPASQARTPVATQEAVPAVPVAREGFAIQVAAVLDRSEADQIVARLVKQGYPGYAIRGQGSAAAYIRVRVGAFKDRQTAEDIAARLERSEGIKPWIVKETP